MTSELPNVQNEIESRGMSIDRAGIIDLLYPLIIQQKDGLTQPVTASVDLQVQVHERQRGAHFSNLVEVLDSYRVRALSTDVLRDFLEELRKQQNERGHPSDKAYVKMQFVYFIAKHAPMSDCMGLVPYRCGFQATLSKQGQKGINVSVPISTVCPCSLKITQLAGHSQRAEVTIQLSESINESRTLWFEDLISIAEASGSSETYSILKRPDEKVVCDDMYGNPRFVEDVVRDVVIRLKEQFLGLQYRVECKSLESVHAHNVYAEVVEQRDMTDLVGIQTT